MGGLFSFHCHFLPVGVCPVSLRRFTSWLSLFVPPRSTCFLLTLLFSALLGRRQSLVFARRKNTFCDLPRVRARHAPARPVRIIAFTSSLNAHNFLKLGVLRWRWTVVCSTLPFCPIDANRCHSVKYGEWIFMRLVCVLYSCGILSWKQALCGEGRVKAKGSRFLFFRSASRRALRTFSPF